MDDYKSIVAKNLDMIGKRELHANDDPKVFDWDKAIQIINENPDHEFSAGLVEDWFWTGSTIWENHGRIQGSPYLMSVWATPIIRDETTDEDYEC